MAEAVDVAIIGGGIAGASVAYYLAREGVRHVLVLDQSAVAAGASGRASGLVSFVSAGHPGLAALLKASADLYHNWEAQAGGVPALNQVGALILMAAEQRATVEREVRLMQEARHDTRLLERDEI